MLCCCAALGAVWFVVRVSEKIWLSLLLIILLLIYIYVFFLHIYCLYISISVFKCAVDVFVLRRSWTSEHINAVKQRFFILLCSSLSFIGISFNFIHFLRILRMTQFFHFITTFSSQYSASQLHKEEYCSFIGSSTWAILKPCKVKVYRVNNRELWKTSGRRHGVGRCCKNASHKRENNGSSLMQDMNAFAYSPEAFQKDCRRHRAQQQQQQ